MPKALNPKAIKEQIGDLLNEIEAINAMATDEDRELTEDENARCDEVFAQIGEDEEKPSGLYADLARAEKFESYLAKSKKVDKAPVFQDKSIDRPRASSIVIPQVNNYRYNKLKAFKGPDAEKEAYIAGRFFAGALLGHADSNQWCRENGIYAAQNETANQLGGVLVPQELERAIIDLREERGTFRKAAKVVPMSSDSMVIPRRASGVTAYYAGEGAAITASDKEWDSVELVARKVAALVKYSTELAEDAIISIGDDLAAEIAYAFADKEDEAGWNGTGAASYGGTVGVMNAMNAGSIVTSAEQQFSAFILSEFESMVGKLPQYAENGAKWYISKPGFWASMGNLADAVGGNTTSHIAGGPELSFLGYPVELVPVLNSTLTDQTSINVVAFGNVAMAATLGNRRGVSVKVSEEAYFANDQLAIKGTTRTAINVHEKGTSTAAGPVVVLQTAAS